jgi:hypothetical protein
MTAKNQKPILHSCGQLTTPQSYVVASLGVAKVIKEGGMAIFQCSPRYHSALQLMSRIQKKQNKA